MLPTTHLSMFDRFRRGGEDRKKAIEQLYTSYSAPLRRYVISQFRYLADDVDDVLHEFIVRKAMMGALLEGYDPSPGQRFRYRLLTALRNYCLQILKTRKGSGIVFSMNEDVDSPLEAEADDFDLLWARQVVGRGIRRMKRQCESQKRRRIWGILKGRFLRPFRHKPATLYPELVLRYGFKSPKEAQKAATAGKRRLAAAIRFVASEYVGSDDATSEINDLWRIINRIRRTRRHRQEDQNGNNTPRKE